MNTHKKRTSLVAREEVTMKDVAKEAKVSLMTVWRVLNGEDNVKEVTKQKVQQAAERINYTLNIGARQLAGTQSYQLLFLYSQGNVGWRGEVVIGMLKGVRKFGYQLLIESVEEVAKASLSHPYEKFDVESVKHLFEKPQFDGVVLIPDICYEEDILNLIRKANIPCVRLSERPQAGIVPRVSIDNFSSTYDMVSYLISLNHKKIAIIAGPKNHYESDIRFDGYKAAMKDAGLAVNDDWARAGSWDVKSGAQIGFSLLKKTDRPTAIYACSDDMAAGVISAAQQLGLKVPDDVSVCGNGNSPLATSIFPNLTSIEQPLNIMGETAIEILAELIKAKKSTSSKKLNSIRYLEHKLVLRDTTAVAPTTSS